METSETGKSGVLFSIFDDMTVLELVHFAREFEERYGVTAAQPATQPIIEALAPVVEVPVEQSSFEVYLSEIGPTKIPLIKKIKDLIGLGLADSKALVDQTPVVIKSNLSRKEADDILAGIKEVGGIGEVR